jgi:hypothetical protein
VCIRVVGVFGSEQIHFVRGTVVVCRFGREQLRFVRGTVVVCVGLAGNNSGSLGVLCALSLYSFPRLLLLPVDGSVRFFTHYPKMN